MREQDFQTLEDGSAVKEREFQRFVCEKDKLIRMARKDHIMQEKITTQEMLRRPEPCHLQVQLQEGTFSNSGGALFFLHRCSLKLQFVSRTTTALFIERGLITHLFRSS